MSGRSRQPSFALLLGIAWLVVACELLALYWGGTAETLLDTDDATRLVQVREFLSGQGWFDLTDLRVQPPGGYESTWSRLIDAGLAGLFLLFRLVADDAMAERLMRTAWPLLWILPAMFGVASIAWRIAGRGAALVTLVLVVVGLPVLQQFKPGSIDHHNVQIALAALTVAATVWSDRMRWAAWAAGCLTGLALAIGLETVPLVALCGAAFALRYVIDGDAAATSALRAYGLSLAAATVAAFLVSVGPDHWSRSVCDTIAINLALPVVLAGSVLALAAMYGAARISVRCAWAALAAAVALTAVAAFEPRCLAGPFAMIDPAIRPIWFAGVQELHPLFAFAHDMPVWAASIMAFPFAALISACVLASDNSLRRDFGFLVASAVFAAALGITLAAVRAHNYPMWLGMPLVAAMVLRLCALLRLETALAHVAASVLLAPMMLSLGAIRLAEAAAPAAPADMLADHKACMKIANYAPLARLPAGLIASSVDFGPFLRALTPHSVLAIPSHRVSAGIVASHQVFADPPEEAHRVLAGLHAAYLMTCGARGPMGLSPEQKAASLFGHLQAGTIPDWLEPVAGTDTGTGGQAIRTFRIKY